jgi:hypothetical protein
MTNNIIEVSNGEAKDRILKYILENNDRIIHASEINEKVLTGTSLAEIEILLERMLTVDKIAEIVISDYSHCIRANKLTEVFINQGGFTKVEKDEAILKEKEHKNKQIEIQNSSIDLQLKKWQRNTYWFLFIIAVVGFGLSICTFKKNLSFPESIEKLENKIEKMELELVKLQTSISVQKNIDSLSKSKVQKKIENIVK